MPVSKLHYHERYLITEDQLLATYEGCYWNEQMNCDLYVFELVSGGRLEITQEDLQKVEKA